MRPRPELVFRAVFLLSLATLIFSAGVLVAHFRFPPYALYRQALAGGEAWYERHVLIPREEAREAVPPGAQRRPVGVTLHRPDGTFDGVTLISVPGLPKAQLIDMQGKVVHEWHVPYRAAFPQPFHPTPCQPENRLRWSALHLFPNGDLIAIYVCHRETPPGYGLVKMDRTSRTLWTAPVFAHHDLDVDPSGNVYVLVSDIRNEPVAGLEYLPPPLFSDGIQVFSPGGVRLRHLALLDALRDSPHRTLIFRVQSKRGDYLHPNSVHVLTPELAAAFPQFQPGQVLVSMRNINTLAVFDLTRRSVVWGARGPWRQQHYARFLPNGRILLFDNLGLGRIGSSRILEYDPQRSDRLLLRFEGTTEHPFFTRWMGMQQTLPNGNLLVTEAGSARLIEVTPQGDLVWEYHAAVPAGVRMPALWTGKRFARAELRFLPSN
jgi:hypothetical protein